MIVAFCGHAGYAKNEDDKKKILRYLEERVGDAYCEFFLGEYGSFDFFAYECAKEFKKKHFNSRLMFITPYLSSDYQKKERFDQIVYPNLENVPLKFAISHRNRWMIEQADIVIAYITHTYGGAYATYRYAMQKKKEVFNLGSFEDSDA